MNTLKDQVKKLPTDPGVYIFKDSSGKIIYIGKSVSIKKRVTSYFAGKNLGPKTDLMVTKIKKIDHIKVFSEFEALLLESELIRTNKPFFNIQAKDDKSPLYVKITSESVPQITTGRKLSSMRGEALIGPFPSAKTTREVLRIVRNIFPYCHHKNPKKPCLYVHLNLCPYPWANEQASADYLKTVGKIKKLLSGKSRELLRQMATEMQTYSKEQKFEQAHTLKVQIKKIESILTTYHSAREFLERPTLVDDLTLLRLTDLKQKLELKTLPKRIECYDISNISGKFATGSMVVMTNGKIDKSQYRKFKIKFKDKPDDFEMIRETIARRLKNDWPKPDLMIIDGGRGQLNAALSIVTKYKHAINVVSLAKRLEEIYVPQKIAPILLSKESPARQLAQEIRDEAHRFAITYHRLLRSRNFLGKS